MESIAFAIPILTGRTDECRLLASESMGRRRAEFADSRRKMTIGREFSWIQKTPEGDLMIIYFEADDIKTASERFMSSQDPFDAWYREQLHYITGIDYGDPNAVAPPPETLCEISGDVVAHAVPVAVATPVLAGKSDELRTWFDELKGPRRDELKDYAQQAGLAKESWHLQSTPDGDLLITFMLVEDMDEAFRGFAYSNHPFDFWLKKKLLEYTGVDYNAPGEGPLPHEKMAELILDWHHAFETAV